MSALTWPDHLLTLRDWDALPEDTGFRLEVVEGVLLVAPRPGSFHQRAVTRLGYLLDGQLAPQLCAICAVDVIIAEHPLTVRAPDVIVTSTALADTNPLRIDAADVQLVVEVLAEGSVRTDRVMKLVEYAEAGIEHYWIVDLAEPANITTYRLRGATYQKLGEHTGTQVLDLDGSTIALDINALTSSRAQRL